MIERKRIFDGDQGVRTFSHRAIEYAIEVARPSKAATARAMRQTGANAGLEMMLRGDAAVRRRAGPTSGSVGLPILLHPFRCLESPARRRQRERARAHR